MLPHPILGADLHTDMYRVPSSQSGTKGELSIINVQLCVNDPAAALTKMAASPTRARPKIADKPTWALPNPAFNYTSQSCKWDTSFVKIWRKHRKHAPFSNVYFGQNFVARDSLVSSFEKQFHLLLSFIKCLKMFSLWTILIVINCTRSENTYFMCVNSTLACNISIFSLPNLSVSSVCDFFEDIAINLLKYYKAVK